MTRRARPVPPLRDDQGSVLLLVVGLVVVAALLVTVVVDVSALFLARRSVAAAADAAAVAGAQAVDEAALYAGGTHGFLPLDPTRARGLVDAYVRDTGLDRSFDGFEVVDVTCDGTSVHVTFAATVRLPFVNLLTPDGASGVTVTASAGARSPFVG